MWNRYRKTKTKVSLQNQNKRLQMHFRPTSTTWNTKFSIMLIFIKLNLTVWLLFTMAHLSHNKCKKSKRNITCQKRTGALEFSNSKYCNNSADAILLQNSILNNWISIHYRHFAHYFNLFCNVKHTGGSWVVVYFMLHIIYTRTFLAKVSSHLTRFQICSNIHKV